MKAVLVVAAVVFAILSLVIPEDAAVLLAFGLTAVAIAHFAPGDWR